MTAFLAAIASIVKGIAGLVTGVLDAFRAWQQQDYGRLRERERQDEADQALRDRIRDADPDSVSDDEAFGPREP